MRKYLHKFESLADFESAYNGSDYHEPWVSLTKEGIPTKVSCSNQNDTVYILEYQGQAPVAGSGDYCIWKDSNDGFYATDSRTIVPNETSIYYLYIDENDQYDWNDGDFYASSVEVLESENVHYIDYNKGPFTGDLIVDASDHGDFSKVTWINPNLGTMNLIPESSINKKYVYSFTGNKINLNEQQEELKIRVLNFRDMPYVDITLHGDGIWPIGTPYAADWVGNITSDGTGSAHLRYVNGGSDMGISADFTPYFRVTIYDDSEQ